METVALVFSIFLLFVVPATVGGLLVLAVFHKRIKLRAADWLLLLLPWAIWLSATLIHGGDKSLSNIAEAFLLGCICALFFGVRSILSVVRPLQQEGWATIALVASCMAAVALWAFVPGLPE